MRRTGMAVAAMVLLAACAPAGGATAAGAAESGFASALHRKDGQAACALLTESARSSLETGSGQECAKAVLTVRGDTSPPRVQVWGDEAEARAGHDTVFLDRTDKGWRVRAAGCSPQGNEQPYECEVAP